MQELGFRKILPTYSFEPVMRAKSWLSLASHGGKPMIVDIWKRSRVYGGRLEVSLWDVVFLRCRQCLFRLSRARAFHATKSGATFSSEPPKTPKRLPLYRRIVEGPPLTKVGRARTDSRISIAICLLQLHEASPLSQMLGQFRERRIVS